MTSKDRPFQAWRDPYLTYLADTGQWPIPKSEVDEILDKLRREGRGSLTSLDKPRRYLSDDERRERERVQKRESQRRRRADGRKRS